MNGIDKQQQLDELYEAGRDLQNELYLLENTDTLSEREYQYAYRNLTDALAEIDEEIADLLKG